MINKIQREIERRRVMLQVKEEIAFKTKMSAIKRNFDRGIRNLETMKLERAKKASDAMKREDRTGELRYLKELRDINNHLIKLTDKRVKIDHFVSRVDILKTVASSVEGLQAVSDEMMKIVNKIDFARVSVDTGVAIAGFDQIEEQLDALFVQLDEMFEVNEDAEELGDEELAILRKQVAEINSPERSFKDSGKDKEIQRLKQVDQLINGDED